MQQWAQKVVQGLVVAMASFFIGSTATRWWDRARPLALLRGFTEVADARNEVTCPEGLTGLTEQSWHTDSFDGPVQDLRTIGHAYAAARIAKGVYEDALAGYDSSLEALRSAANDGDTMAALKALMSRRGPSDGMDMALKNQLVVLQPSQTERGKDVLPVVESDDNGGCYEIAWKSSTCLFSDDLKKASWRRARVEPFVNAMRALDRNLLASAFSQLKPHLERQLKIHTEIVELLKQIVDANQRLAAKLLVANYGASVMMVWPDAVLQVSHAQSKAQIAVDCYLASTHDEAPTVREIEGVFSLAPGEQATIWAITRECQGKTNQGAVMRTLFTDPSTAGRVKMTITRRGAFSGSAVQTTTAPFVESAELPKYERPAAGREQR